MSPKTLAVIGSTLAIAVIIFLVVRGRDDRSHYTDAQRAEVRSIVSTVDSGYTQVDVVNAPMLQSVLAISNHQGNHDSLVRFVETSVAAQRPVLTELRKELDSLEHLKRDSSSAFTKGLDLYVRATRQAVSEMEGQAFGARVVADPNRPDMPPPPPPSKHFVSGMQPEIDPATPPLAMPFAHTTSILKRLNEERANAKAMMAGE